MKNIVGAILIFIGTVVLVTIVLHGAVDIIDGHYQLSWNCDTSVGFSVDSNGKIICRRN